MNGCVEENSGEVARTVSFDVYYWNIQSWYQKLEKNENLTVMNPYIYAGFKAIQSRSIFYCTHDYIYV